MKFFGALAPLWLSFTALFGQTPIVEDLGAPARSSTLDGKYIFRTNDGHTHLVLYYSGLSPFQIMHVDLTTGVSRTIDAVPGRPAPNGTTLHSNGKLYIPSGDPGYLFEYDPTSGNSRNLGALADKGGQWGVLGDDGAVFIGETIKGYVERYDPIAGRLENFGIMDDPGPPYYRYAYTLGADQRYVYAGMGQDPWYLVIYDRQTRRQQVYWKELNCKEVTVSRGTAGGWYVNRKATEPDGVYRGRTYRLQNGQPVELQVGERPSVVAYELRGNVLNDLTQAPALLGYEIDLSKALPDSGTNGVATVLFRRVGEATWRQASAPIKLSPYNLKRVYPFSDTQLLLISDFYGPILTRDVNSGQIKSLGRTSFSLYSGLSAGLNWYFSGYPAATLRYDPAKPWTLTPSTANSASPKENPYQLSGIAKYHYYTAKGADNFIYVGVHHERDSVGGELGWYDPFTNQLTTLRAPFEKLDVRDLIAADRGNKIVYSSVATEPGVEAKLFIFDTQAKRLIRQIAVIPGLTAYDKLVETTPGKVLGILGDKFFLVDILTGQVAYVKPLGGQAFQNILSYDRRPALGPDGKVYIYLDNSIARITPALGTIERVVQTAPPAGNLMFLGNDLYIYGGTNLRRVRGLISTNSSRTR